MKSLQSITNSQMAILHSTTNNHLNRYTILHALIACSVSTATTCFSISSYFIGGVTAGRLFIKFIHITLTLAQQHYITQTSDVDTFPIQFIVVINYNKDLLYSSSLFLCEIQILQRNKTIKFNSICIILL